MDTDDFPDDFSQDIKDCDRDEIRDRLMDLLESADLSWPTMYGEAVVHVADTMANIIDDAGDVVTDVDEVEVVDD